MENNKRTLELTKARDYMADLFDELENLYSGKNTNGFETGFIHVDDILVIQEGDLVVVAGRPSMGKTAYMLNMALNIETKSSNNGAYISLGLAGKRITKRLLACEAGIGINKMNHGFLAEDEWGRLGMASGRLSNVEINILDDTGCDLDSIVRRIRTMNRLEKLKYVMIDDINKITTSGRGREEEMSRISRTLKSLALELKMRIIVAAGVGESVEMRADRRPYYTDILHGEQLVADADIIKFLYRDDYYNEESEFRGLIEVIVAKNSDGPVGTVKLNFLHEMGKLTNYTGTID